MTIASLIALAAVIETAFKLNGLGEYLVTAALNDDFATVQGISLVLVTVFVVDERDRRHPVRGARSAGDAGSARPMSSVAPVPNEMLQAVPSTTRRHRGVPGLRGTGIVGHVCAAVLLVAVLMAVFGPLIAPYDPNQLNISYAFVGANGNHYLGFDGQGRDLLSRILVGARSSLIGPMLVAGLAVVTGAVLAVAAAWIGGWFDSSLGNGARRTVRVPRDPAGRRRRGGVRAGHRQRGVCTLDRLPSLCRPSAARSGIA